MLKKLYATVTFSAVALALTGCATLTPRMQPAVKIVCPTLQEYSKETQNKAADELDAHEAKVPTVAAMLGDYRDLRAEIRACAQ
jgi:hypothetical protein